MTDSTRKEKRKYFRVSLASPICGTICPTENGQIKKDEAIKICIVNVGPGGLSFVSLTDFELNPETIYNVTTHILGEKVSVLSEIVWKEKYKANSYQYGVRFFITENEIQKNFKLLNTLTIQLRKKGSFNKNMCDKYVYPCSFTKKAIKKE